MEVAILFLKHLHHQGYLGSNAVLSTSDFGRLGYYAHNKGYIVEGDLTTWLNNNGFQLDANSVYWSSTQKSPNIIWNVSFKNGLTATTFGTYSNNLLFVRGIK